MRSIAHFDLHIARITAAHKSAEVSHHLAAVRRRRARARLLAIPPPMRRAVGFRLVEAGLALALDDSGERAPGADLGLARQ